MRFSDLEHASKISQEVSSQLLEIATLVPIRVLLAAIEEHKESHEVAAIRGVFREALLEL